MVLVRGDWDEDGVTVPDVERLQCEGCGDVELELGVARELDRVVRKKGAGAVEQGAGAVRIRLTRSLPIEKRHGADKGRVFVLVRREAEGRRRRAFFVGDAGEECAAFSGEYELVRDGR